MNYGTEYNAHKRRHGLEEADSKNNRQRRTNISHQAPPKMPHEIVGKRQHGQLRHNGQCSKQKKATDRIPDHRTF